MNQYCRMQSPFGPLLLTATGAAPDALGGVYFADEMHAPRIDAPGPNQLPWREAEGLPLFVAARLQLQDYFAGRRRDFDLPLAPAGTPFQLRVWRALREIPYGANISYAELAQRIGSPRAARAVGLANSRNPISIIVPCHRVIGRSGRLTGYAGGLENKRKLLELENGGFESSSNRLA